MHDGPMSRRGDFYEDDEPIDEVRAAFERGEKHLTAAPDHGSRTELLKVQPAGSPRPASVRGKTELLRLPGLRLLKPFTGRPTSTTPQIQN